MKEFKDISTRLKSAKKKFSKSYDKKPQASFDIAMNEKVSRENLSIKETDTVINNSGFDNTYTPQVKPLIPLPPKAKYNYLEKWLVRY